MNKRRLRQGFTSSSRAICSIFRKLVVQYHICQQIALFYDCVGVLETKDFLFFFPIHIKHPARLVESIEPYFQKVFLRMRTRNSARPTIDYPNHEKSVCCLDPAILCLISSFPQRWQLPLTKSSTEPAKAGS
jgi:hypothetical protein